MTGWGASAGGLILSSKFVVKSILAHSVAARARTALDTEKNLGEQCTGKFRRLNQNVRWLGDPASAYGGGPVYCCSGRPHICMAGGDCGGLGLCVRGSPIASENTRSTSLRPLLQRVTSSQ